LLILLHAAQGPFAVTPPRAYLYVTLFSTFSYILHSFFFSPDLRTLLLPLLLFFAHWFI